MISGDQDLGRWESLTYLIDDRLLEEINPGRVKNGKAQYPKVPRIVFKLTDGDI